MSEKIIESWTTENTLVIKESPPYLRIIPERDRKRVESWAVNLTTDQVIDMISILKMWVDSGSLNVETRNEKVLQSKIYELEKKLANIHQQSGG